MFGVVKYDFRNIREVVASLTELGANASGVSLPIQSAMREKRTYWKKYRNEISVHSRGYLMPKIRQLRPNENEASMQNRLLNYEPITTPFWNEAVTKMKRILLASTADVTIFSDKTEDFIKAQNFDGLTLYNFFATNMTERTINEPNGLTVVYPLKYAEKEGINPIQFICDKEIVYLDKNTAVFACLGKSEDRKSVV